MSVYTVVMTGIGPDRPGLVAGLSELICRHEGNIADSTMTRLAGQFAMILIATLPDGIALAQFQQAAEVTEQTLGIQLHVSLLEKGLSDPDKAHSSTERKTGRAYLVSVAGSDRTGITHHVSQLLATYHANITDLNAHRIEGEDGPVYVMVVEFDLPHESSASHLEKGLDQLGRDMSLDVRFRSIEAVAL